MPERTLPAAALIAQTSDYKSRLPGRLTEVVLLWDLARSGDADALEALQGHAHQLRGSAGMYGYTRIDEAARILDRDLAEFQAAESALTDDWAERLNEAIAALVASAQAPSDFDISDADVPATPDLTEREEAVVLVADDDPTVRDLLCLYLQHAGFRTLIASNGIEALDHVRHHRPDVVLMDLQMPEMDGTEAIRWLRDDDTTREIPIIVLTADDEMDTVLRVLSFEVSGYLTKPTEVNEVVSKVFSILMSTP